MSGIMHVLEDYLGDPDPIIDAMAQKLALFKQQLTDHQITQDEFDDLSVDATTIADTVRAGKTIAELNALDQTIAILQDLVGIAGKV